MNPLQGGRVGKTRWGRSEGAGWPGEVSVGGDPMGKRQLGLGEGGEQRSKDRVCRGHRVNYFGHTVGVGELLH